MQERVLELEQEMEAEKEKAVSMISPPNIHTRYNIFIYDVQSMFSLSMHSGPNAPVPIYLADARVASATRASAAENFGRERTST